MSYEKSSFKTWPRFLNQGPQFCFVVLLYRTLKTHKNEADHPIIFSTIYREFPPLLSAIALP